MKVGLAFLLFLCLFHGVKCQSFQVSFPDTVIYGPADDSTTLSCWTNDLVTNMLNQPLDMDVVRVQDDTACPGWASAFCFQFCSQPQIDSIRTTMGPKEVVNIAVHFMVTGIPDSGTVLMKFKNVNSVSEVYYQRFYAITQSSSGIHNSRPDVFSVKIFPMPVRSGAPVYFSIAGSVSDVYEMLLYRADGCLAWRMTGLHNGDPYFFPDLPPGFYSYQVLDRWGFIRSGKILVLAGH